MWLGGVPAEFQGLTIPEEKLISLYRHNSCRADEILFGRVGYVPDPLLDPTKYTTSDTIPINNR
jgi:hypothetical protein